MCVCVCECVSLSLIEIVSHFSLFLCINVNCIYLFISMLIYFNYLNDNWCLMFVTSDIFALHSHTHGPSITTIIAAYHWDVM